MNAFTRRIAPPVFEGDDEKTRQASLINLIALSFLAFAFIVFIANVLGGRASIAIIAVNAIAIALLLPVKYWVNLGKLAFAQAWLLTVLFFCVTSGTAFLGTIRAPVAALYLPCVVIAGLLFDRKGIVVATTACSISVMGLILAENAGLLPTPDYKVGLSQWVTYTALCGFTGSLVYSINQFTKDALARARRELEHRKLAEAALEIANQKLSQRVKQVENLHEGMRIQANRDDLTGLSNRRYLNEALAREVARADQEASPLSFVMLDVDHFKNVNDKYGHPAGDEVLVQLARLLTTHARGSDIACRYGGEEFLLVMPGTSLESAGKRAEELRQKCEAFEFNVEGMGLHVTLSFGVASFPEHGQGWEAVVHCADKALYQSKHDGRNRVTIWQEHITQLQLSPNGHIRSP